MMKKVEIVLPSGFGRDLTTLKNTEWTQKHSEPDHHPSADEESLLGKKPESLHGDSSGCVSGHGSVTSCGESGSHISSASDSGTEQPKTPPVSEHTLHSTLPKDYVAMPSDNSGSTTLWSRKGQTSSDYCILGVDSPASKSENSEQTIPYNACDSGAPYVMRGDVVKVSNPGYVPVEKNTSYVVAGNKKMVIPDLLPRESDKFYVQISTTAGAGVPPWTPQPITEENTSKTGYASVGEAGVTRIPEASNVPHRHFEGKATKQD